MKNEIRVTCEGRRVKVGALKGFQGGLKRITPEAEDRLKKSILQHGFSFPVFVWRGQILDGHQRIGALKALMREGYRISGGVPIVEIEADNRAQAAEKLLLINSKYGRITEQGLSGFLLENGLEIETLLGEIDLPDVDFDKLLSGGESEKRAGAGGGGDGESIDQAPNGSGDPSGKVTVKSFPAFLGAFCLHQAKEEGFKRLKEWKANPASCLSFQAEMIGDFARAISARGNYFDFLTVPPPNAKRKAGYLDYPISLVARAVAEKVGLEYREVFEPRRKNTGHGVGFRTHNAQEPFKLLNNFSGAGGCCLLLDDVSTTRWTVSECQRVMAGRKYGLIALVYCYWGNV